MNQPTMPEEYELVILRHRVGTKLGDGSPINCAKDPQ
jgi:hypothetical protein